MNLINRLIFGCGRLTGGASRGYALDLLDRVFDSGIKAIDLAPGYGLGTAETVAGEALQRRGGGRDVSVMTKIGLPRPPLGHAKTWLRAIKRSLAGGKPRRLVGWAPPPTLRMYGAGDFRTAALTQSLETSLSLLPWIDRLLLHACGPDECTPSVAASIGTLTASIGAQPGYGIGGKFDAALDALYPDGFWASAAIDPAVFSGEHHSARRGDLSLHSIVPCGTFLYATKADFAAQIDRIASGIVAGTPQTRQIAAFYALAAIREPTAQMIYASNDHRRLADALAAFSRIDLTAIDAGI